MTHYKEPRDYEDMSLNEQIFMGAIENSTNQVFRDKNDGVDEGAPDDDDDDHMFI